MAGRGRPAKNTNVAKATNTNVAKDTNINATNVANTNNTNTKNTSTQEVTEVVTPVENTSSVETVNVDNQGANALNVNALMDMISQLQNQVMGLQNQLKETEAKAEQITSVESVPQPVVLETVKDNAQENTERILDYLTNKKSDREITIVHNRERLCGSTAIRLSGLNIDFHTMGEQRVLTWQQFEELVSKYRKFFDKHIIMLAPEHKDLAERYHVPCMEIVDKNYLSRDDLNRVGKMTVEQLSDFYQSLNPQDQEALCSYWLGKAYQNDPDFYNRYKIETLNRLSDCGAFDNILTVMNYDYRKTNDPTQTQMRQGDNIQLNSNAVNTIRIN